MHNIFDIAIFGVLCTFVWCDFTIRQNQHISNSTSLPGLHLHNMANTRSILNQFFPEVASEIRLALA